VFIRNKCHSTGLYGVARKEGNILLSHSCETLNSMTLEDVWIWPVLHRHRASAKFHDNQLTGTKIETKIGQTHIQYCDHVSLLYEYDIFEPYP
jgi:hypothetical protein